MTVLKKNLKIGIFGGSFNPPHFGHINSLLTVQSKFLLDLVYVVPVFHSPLASPIKEADSFQRLEMLKRAFQDYPFVQVDEQEVLRPGRSYSYITVENIAAKQEPAELFFILGMDQFEKLDQWKNVLRILKKSHFIVTSRPGHSSFPQKKQDLPECLKELALFPIDKGRLALKNLKDIYFCSLNDKNISSSLIRERAREGSSLKPFVPSSVEAYIRSQYISSGKMLEDIQTLAEFCCKELQVKKAFNVKLYDLSHKNLPFYLGLIASSLNPPHSRGLMRYLEQKVKESFGLLPLGKEGEGQWMALDYGDLGVHIFYDYNREKYSLDEIWGAASKFSGV